MITGYPYNILGDDMITLHPDNTLGDDDHWEQEGWKCHVCANTPPSMMLILLILAM